MKEQSAVEWLEHIYLTTGIDRNVHFHQAKEMEKEQIIDAFNEGQEYEYQYHNINNTPKFDSQTYYNETYGSKGSDDHIVDTNEMISSQTEIAMIIPEAISILKIHQQWRLGADIVMIEPKDLTEAIDVILNNHLKNQVADFKKSVDYTKVNLDVTTYRNGDVIPNVTDPTAWAALTTGAWCSYDNDSANDAIYGKLYNWYAANDSRGLAPVGYHIPTDKEMNLLNLADNPTYGGTRNVNGSFSNVNYNGGWWSSTEKKSKASDAWYHYLDSSYSNVYRSGFGKTDGFSVRCLRDDKN